jgi:hypothetical protein
MKVVFEDLVAAHAFKVLSEEIVRKYEEENPKLVTKDILISYHVFIDWSEKSFSDEENKRINEELELLKNKLKAVEKVFYWREDGAKYQLMIGKLKKILEELYEEEKRKLNLHTIDKKL